MNSFVRYGPAFAAFAFTLIANAQVAVPGPGASPRVDAIKKAGVLRVGVLANAPWLVENTTSAAGDQWSGPAWALAKEYAKRLNVKLEAVAVSQDQGTGAGIQPGRYRGDAAGGNAGSPEGRRFRHLFDHQRVPVRPGVQSKVCPGEIR